MDDTVLQQDKDKDENGKDKNIYKIIKIKILSWKNKNRSNRKK